MKKHSLFLGAVALMMASCSVQEEDFRTSVRDDVVFHAVLEQPVEENTRVYVNDELYLRWHADDRVSIFNHSTANQQYRFNGETGDNGGDFTLVGEAGAAGDPIADVVAVYPYQESTRISESEVLTVNLPAEQTYAENSFGPNSATMVSVTSDNMLNFKSVGGFLKIRLYGEGYSVRSLTLKGNNGEKLSGEATVTMPLDETPSIEMAEDAGTEITLVCPDPVALGATADQSKEFWFVVPPVEFEEGFTVTVRLLEGLFVKSTSKHLTFERNRLSKMSPFQITEDAVFQPVPEAVDLGLSVRWASFNLGAVKPEEFGEYYAWGETQPYYQPGDAQSESPVWKEGKSDGYDWTSYQWCLGTRETLTKYCTNASYGNDGFTDGKTELDPEDDAAHVLLGGDWRMPTAAEIDELIANCNAEWTTENGVPGYRFTSNKEGYTGNSVFLPAAGYRLGTTYVYVETDGLFWSKSVNTGAPYHAYDLHVKADRVWRGNGSSRPYGFPIRPVTASTGFVSVTGVTLNKSSLSLYAGLTSTLTATVLPEDASNKTLVWTSSDESVATVNQSGKVTAVAKGSATITASASDGSGKSASCAVTVTAVTNLSSSATANCYIVSKAGAYKFKTVKGNSSTSVGTVSSVTVLWESFGNSTKPSKGSVIAKASFSGNYVYFETPSTLKNGNAVIAVKNSSGTIIWSWHIWVCSGYDPAATAQTYYNSAGKMMDRNLGATSASPGTVASLGLLYQWGRKDPFLGSSSISTNTKAASTLSWPTPVASNSTTGTISYTLAHPTTFIKKNTKNDDWHYSGSTTANNTRWKATKTAYDPCPPGWHVPEGGKTGVWAKASGVKEGYFTCTYNSSKKGVNFSGKFGSASTIWYPAAPTLVGLDGSFSNQVDSGFYWSVTPDPDVAYFACNLYLSNYVWPTDGGARGDAYSVRCIKE